MIGVRSLLRYRSSRRLSALSIFLALGAVPMLLWTAGLEMAGAVRGGYAVVPHFPPAVVLRQGFWEVRHWALPTGLPSPPGPMGFVVIGVLVGMVLAARRQPSLPMGRGSVHPLLFVLGTFIAAYAAVLLVSASLWAEQVPLDERMLFPAYSAALALAACLAARAAESGRLLRAAALAGVATVTIATAAAGIDLLRREEVGRQDYAGHQWETSEGVRELAGLPAGTALYSNFPDAVYYRSGRRSRLVPRPVLVDGKPNSRYEEQLSRLADQVAHQGAVVIVFRHEGRDFLPSPTQLTEGLRQPPDRVLRDSVMWRGVRLPA
jgi:hypothetical protein